MGTCFVGGARLGLSDIIRRARGGLISADERRCEERARIMMFMVFNCLRRSIEDVMNGTGYIVDVDGARGCSDGSFNGV